MMKHMKKYLVVMTMLLTVGLNARVAAQTQPTPRQDKELVDSARQNGLEVYSDTTDTAAVDDPTLVSSQHRIGGHYYNGTGFLNGIFGDDFPIEGMAGMVFALAVVLIIFVISPLVIFGLVLFFIFRNRKQKMKLAEMAMKQGQPIPDQLLDEHRETDDELWQKGLRQTFLGVGLLAFFGYVGSTLGVGVGILVTVIGLGKLAIVKTKKS